MAPTTISKATTGSQSSIAPAKTNKTAAARMANAKRQHGEAKRPDPRDIDAMHAGRLVLPIGAPGRAPPVGVRVPVRFLRGPAE